MVQVLETTLEQVKEKIAGMRTNFNKADYLESAFKKDLSIDIQRFALETLASIYDQDRMYAKAARAMSNKARFDPTFKERIVSYLRAAEFFCMGGTIDDAEEMFNRAVREANEVEKKNILQKRKEMYFTYAEKLEKQGKRSSTLKFYEKLIKIKLDDTEKEKVKEKLVKSYRLLGLFKEADVVSKL